jgi:tetratricopeptide (TPR) repeat protein
MASDTTGGSSASLGQAAIRERNYGTALQLLRRAYRGDPTPENARWLATAYEEAGYAQLASLYRELSQERKEIQFQAPKPPSTLEQLKQLPAEPPDRKTIPLPQPIPRPTPPPSSSDQPIWVYKPTPIDPKSISRQTPIRPMKAEPTASPEKSSEEAAYLPVQHAPDLKNPQQGSPFARRLNQLHRQFKDQPTAELALQLAEAYDEQNNFKEAQRYYREVLDRDQSLLLRPMVQERLEELRRIQNPTATAEQSSFADLSVQNLLKLGEKLEQEGEVARAEQVYRQILKMDATLDAHAAARKGLNRLYPDGKR